VNSRWLAALAVSTGLACVSSVVSSVYLDLRHNPDASAGSVSVEGEVRTTRPRSCSPEKVKVRDARSLPDSLGTTGGSTIHAAGVRQWVIGALDSSDQFEIVPSTSVEPRIAIVEINKVAIVERAMQMRAVVVLSLKRPSSESAGFSRGVATLEDGLQAYRDWTGASGITGPRVQKTRKAQVLLDQLNLALNESLVGLQGQLSCESSLVTEGEQ